MKKKTQIKVKIYTDITKTRSASQLTFSKLYLTQ